MIGADRSVALITGASRVDALIHNAGIGGDQSIAQMDGSTVATIIDTNLRAPIELTRVLLPGMLERRRGAIVFVASVVGHIGVPASGSTAHPSLGCAASHTRCGARWRSAVLASRSSHPASSKPT